MRFRGQLFVDDLLDGLPVAIDLTGSKVIILVGDEELATYSLRDTRAARVTSERFALSLGDESATFVADDPIRFSYDALPLLEGAVRPEPTKGMWALIKEFLGGGPQQPEPTPVAQPLPEPSVVVDEIARPAPRSTEGALLPPALDETILRMERQIERVAAMRRRPDGGAPVDDADLEPDLIVFVEPIDSVAEAEPEAGSVTPQEPVAGTAAPVVEEQAKPGPAAVDHDIPAAFDEVESRGPELSFPNDRRPTAEDLAAVARRLSQAVREVQEGTLDPERGAAMAALAHAMAEAMRSPL